MAEPEAAVEEHTEPWHLKYRPTILQHVYGQPEVVKAIEGALKAKARQHTFLFIGPSGTGKTTLARIMAAEFGCEPNNVTEIAAAVTTGVDDIRALLSGIQYAAFGEKGGKAYIIDECQRLSGNAWDALLKATEEPPPHVFFFFCTTNPAKIPKAILTRGPNYALQSVSRDNILDLLEDICKAEFLDTVDDVLYVIADACEGSPRQALVMLASVYAMNREEAQQALVGFGETPEVIDLCRKLIRGGMRWPDVVSALTPLKEQGAEAIRIQVVNYVAAVLMGNVKEKDVGFLLDVLDAFSIPYNPTDKLAPVLLSFGRFVDFGGR